MELSIIIPIYNAQKYLRQCLDTVVACQELNIECILVSDGSTDDSLAICKEYAKKDQRFQVIDKNNEGVSMARNAGILYASGEYIFFLDADDYLDVNKWSEILKNVKGRQYDFIAFSYYTLYENGTVKEELFPIKEITTDMDTVRKLVLTTASLNTCWGKLFRRSIIISNGLEFKKGVKTGEDTVFVMDYFLKAKSYSIQNISILYYRQHEASAMHRINMDKKLNDFQAIYNYRKEIVQQSGDEELRLEMYRQLFSVLTNLFLEFSNSNSFQNSRRCYIETKKRPMVQEIISQTPYKRLSPIYKKMEYCFIKLKMFHCLTVYFKLKSRFL